MRPVGNTILSGAMYKFAFRLLHRQINVSKLLFALREHPGLWNQNTLRTTHLNTPHAEVSDIWLRFNRLPKEGEEHLLLDEHESIDYPAYDILSVFRPVVMSVFAYVGGERLGRVLVTKLPPGGKIYPHEDSGSHAEYYERFHVCLQAGEGTLFRLGDDWVTMEPGDLWWVQNAANHEVVNNSNIDRIHLIVDAKCRNWVDSVFSDQKSIGQE